MHLTGFVAVASLVVIGVKVNCDQTANQEAKLLAALFADYNPNVRPVTNYSDTVMVKLDPHLRRVAKLCAKSNQLITHMWWQQSWTDAYLKWNPEDYGGIKQVYVEKKDVWRPDLIVFNSVGPFEPSKQDDQAIVYYTGAVTLIVPHEVKSDCVLNHTQTGVTCNITIGSWVHSALTVDVTPGDVDRVLFIQNKKWTLEDVAAIREVKHYDCCPEAYPRIQIVMKFTKNTAPDDNAKE